VRPDSRKLTNPATGLLLRAAEENGGGNIQQWLTIITPQKGGARAHGTQTAVRVGT
jgi:hypothetical protein